MHKIRINIRIFIQNSYVNTNFVHHCIGLIKACRQKLTALNITFGLFQEKGQLFSHFYISSSIDSGDKHITHDGI